MFIVRVRFGKLNSNIELIFKNVEYLLIVKRKSVPSLNIPNLTGFLLPVKVIFKIVDKLFDIDSKRSTYKEKHACFS